MKKLVGPVGSQHTLRLRILSTWKPPDGPRTWCRALTITGEPVGFWTASRAAQRGAMADGLWEVVRIRDEYTQLKMKGRPLWRQSDSS